LFYKANYDRCLPVSNGAVVTRCELPGLRRDELPSARQRGPRLAPYMVESTVRLSDFNEGRYARWYNGSYQMMRQPLWVIFEADIPRKSLGARKARSEAVSGDVRSRSIDTPSASTVMPAAYAPESQDSGSGARPLHTNDTVVTWASTFGQACDVHKTSYTVAAWQSDSAHPARDSTQP